jgi:hypothetical protein
VLERVSAEGKPVVPKDYSIVLWRNGANIKEMLEPQPMLGKELPILVSGLKDVIRAMEWNLDQVKIETDKTSIQIDDQPKVIFCSSLPNWELLANKEWLGRQMSKVRDSNAVVPIFNK